MKAFTSAVRLGAVASVAAGLVLAGSPQSAVAYQTFKQLCGEGRWSSNSAGVYLAAANIPSTWVSPISSARAQWNGMSGSAFSYGAPSRISGPIPPRGATGVGIRRYDIQANDGLPLSVPAWTSNLDPLTLRHGVAYLNLSSRWTWNLVGTMSPSTHNADLRTIVTHELGHGNGIAHPWQASCDGSLIRSMTAAETASVMNAQWQKKWATNSDDKAAMAYLY